MKIKIKYIVSVDTVNSVELANSRANSNAFHAKNHCIDDDFYFCKKHTLEKDGKIITYIPMKVYELNVNCEKTEEGYIIHN